MSGIFPARVTNAKNIRTGYPWLPRKATVLAGTEGFCKMQFFREA